MKLIKYFVILAIALGSVVSGLSQVTVTPQVNSIAVTAPNKTVLVLRTADVEPLQQAPQADKLPDGYLLDIGSGGFGNLEIATGYMLDIYSEGKLIETKTVSTLAKAPEEAAGVIVFAGNFADRIALGFNQRDAENGLIIISKGEPKGIDWNTIRGMMHSGIQPGWGSPSAKLGPDTYIAYAGPYASPQVREIAVPNYAEYTFTVFGYNGEGLAANANTAPVQNNTRTKAPAMPPPVAIEPGEMNLEEGFVMARWKTLPMPGLAYVLSVATDPAFTNLLEGFEAIDFGNGDEAPIMFDGPQRLYYRVRAEKGREKSEWSNIMQVDIAN